VLFPCFPWLKSCRDHEIGAAGTLRPSLAFSRRSRAARAFRGERIMLKWALIFAIVALIAGGLGFGGVAGAAAGVAKILFFLFVLGFVIFLALGLMAGKKIAGN